MTDAILPGALRSRAALESRTDTPDGAGGGTPQWTTLAMLWVNVAPQRAVATYPADGQRQMVTHVITLRYRTGITNAMRFRIGARLFDINAVHDPDERRIRLACACEEVT